MAVDDRRSDASPIAPPEAFAESVHKYIREHIQLADTKAAFLTTIGATIVAFLYDRDVPDLFLKNPLDWGAAGVLALLSIVLLLVSIVAALGVVVPRKKGPRSGLIFWEAVADQPSGDAYAQAVVSRTADELVQEKLRHAHALAGVCRRKYRYLDIAVRFGAIGMICTVIFLATR